MTSMGSQNHDGDIYLDGGEETSELHRREENPQGLLYFTRYDSVPIMVDALFDSPTSREFTQSELASKADLTPRTVSNRLNILSELGIIKPVDETNRFTLNLEGAITWKLRELDGLIKEAQSSQKSPIRSDRVDEDSEEGASPIGEIDEDPNDVMDRVRNQVTAPNTHAD